MFCILGVWGLKDVRSYGFHISTKKKKKRLLRFDLGIIGANRDSYRKTSVAISKLPVVQSSSCVWPLATHGLEHTRPPCPSPSPGVCPSSCSLSQRCHPTISFFEPALLLPPSLFPSIRILPNESVLRIRWPKYWSCSCSVSPSNEYSGLISFKVDWFDLLAVQDSQESSPAPQSESINSLALSLLYGPTLTSVHDYWRDCSLDYIDFCR